MLNPNQAFEDDLYFEYLKDPDSVSQEWKSYFEKNKKAQTGGISYQTILTKSAAVESKRVETTPKNLTGNQEILEPLSNVQSKVAENMQLSLEVPTATSVRTIPVKALDENRRIINKYLLKMKRRKVSFTHVLAWAIVKALQKYPGMNDSFRIDGGKAFRVKKESINIGLAVDITKKDGTRTLLVPSVKNAGVFNFSDFIIHYDALIDKARNNKLDIDDLMNTTVTLTNPGMIGTSFSSPRLMSGQGLIVAAGAIDYPTEFQAMKPEFLTTFAVSKVLTITSTYDHRIIQGAESAEFLSYISKLLIGEEQFYDQIFASLRIPFEPIRWAKDISKGSHYGTSDPFEMYEKSAHVVLMINAYRVRGHLLASINPLGQESYYYPELDPAYYGFTIWDLDREFHADDNWKSNNLALREIIEIMRETYCGPIGFEFMHIQDPVKKEWIKFTLEEVGRTRTFSPEDKLRFFRKIVEAEEFENFLHTKFVGHKRFSLEGGEAMIVMLDKIFELAADNELKSIALGMAHRGRLNVLANITAKPLEKIFNEFEGTIDPYSYHGSGDVKYHLGEHCTYRTSEGKAIDVILSPNPSHLELVNPVIEGMARALENKIEDASHSLSLPVLIHGDAAFAGQGIVAETLNLSQLQGYKTGGTIHIIINNQIGFTTSAQDARSTVYATDVAKMIQVPIIHVNGNDPEAVVSASIFAFEYRNRFKSDVIIDMICYRKYGHNEGDEPSYTQPLLYKKIKLMKPLSNSYNRILISDGTITEESAVNTYREVQDKYYNAYSNRKSVLNNNEIVEPEKVSIFEKVNTQVSDSILEDVARAITSVPDDFTPNSKIKTLLTKRLEMVESTVPQIDWAMAEALAFGTLLVEGKNIRITGQDSRRGTFSQRHSVLTDVTNENIFVPLQNISSNQGKFRIYDSPLSEVAVLGFEYGYSVIDKDGLVLWEAQFGDFVNGAQAIIDQFIACAETKWNQKSNLVLLLPHSYDGQGSEHSSARFERFLQLGAEENIIVANLTTPAQYFHILRRQVYSDLKKPLFIMTPKSMLRHPHAVSSAKELAQGSFTEILDDSSLNVNDVKRILLCTGKLYYELLQYRTDKQISDTAIIRVEQLYPLHTELLSSILKKYRKAKEIYWVQEEPKNMGAWNYISPRISEVLPQNLQLDYAGRKESASTASGSLKIHNEEQKNVLIQAFGQK